jgi:tetratricopeptide (TPR) repeat protein
MSHAVRSVPPWLAVKSLFERLVELPVEQRAAALLLAGVAPEIAAEVRELLAQHEAEEREGGGFLARPALLQAQDQEAVDRRGERLGPWLLTTPLGAGGMGEVWEARRDDGAYEARVAVKVLRGGADSALLLQHFAQEQRLLARLNHPHIARLLDAGRTADEHPYFVLEAVDGQPIDVTAAGQPPAARLRLFLQLADAVAHAHRQQLIHRDLKPANVLVTAEGQVKLLDFGIAQALDHAATPAGPRALTPGWASPEQRRGEAVTAATDIYSLGALLHLLLSGERPDAEAAGEARRALDADLQAILARALAEQPQARYASVDALAADLRAFQAGQPVAARPHTAGYLAGRFVRRHRAAVAASALALLAVVGGLGATAWQARDAAAALALAALVAGLGVSSWQYRRAAAARDDARERLAQTSTLVRDIVMRYADTVTYLPGGLKMKAELLKDTIAYLERLAAGAPGDAALAGERAKALARLADMQLPGLDASLEEPEDALRNADAALALFPDGEAAHRDDPVFHMWWLRALRVRMISQRQAGETRAALHTAERQRGLLQTLLQRFPDNADLRAEYGSVLLNIGQAYDSWVSADLHQPDLALQAFAEAEAVYHRLHQEHPADGGHLYQLGTLAGAQMITLLKLGRMEQAIAQGRRAVAQRDASVALQPDNVAYRDGAAGERNNFVRVLLERSSPADVAEALEVSERGEQIILALQAQDPGLPTWLTRRRLFAMHRGRALLAAGQADEALPRLRDAMEAMAGAVSGAMLRRRGWCGLELARAHAALGQALAARAALQQALTDLQAQPADDAEAQALLDQARALQRQGVAGMP